MDESKNRKIGAVLSYISIIATTIVQLLYTPLLIRKLGQSEYGLYSLINSIIGYLTILDLGFGNAIVIYTARYRAEKKIDEEKKMHGMFFVIFCIIALIIGVIGLVLYFNIDNLFGKNMTTEEINKAKILMLVLTFNLVITFIFNIYTCIINAYEKFIYQKAMSIINTIIKPIIMIPLLFMGFKSITMVIVITIVNLFVYILNYLYCKKRLNIRIKFSGFDKVLFKTIFAYSIWIFLGVIVDKINWSLDNFILGSVSGTIAVSIYSLSSTVNQLFINLSTAISSVMLPKMSKLVAKNISKDELTKEFIKVGRIQYYIIFLMASGLILVGKEFFLIWAGKQYGDSYYIALILILPTCIPLIQNLGISIRQAMNKHKFSSIVSIVVAILNLGISIPLAKQYGAIGASIGTGIGIGLTSFINNIYYHRVIGIDVIKFWKEIFKITIPLVIPWITTIIFKRIYCVGGLLSIIVYGSVFTIIYLFVAYLLCMNEYERNILKKIVIRG